MTQKKQALQNAQLMAAIVGGANDALIGGMLEGIITTWNPAAQRLYGSHGEEIPGHSGSALAALAALALLAAGQE